MMNSSLEIYIKSDEIFQSINCLAMLRYFFLHGVDGRRLNYVDYMAIESLMEKVEFCDDYWITSIRVCLILTLCCMLIIISSAFLQSNEFRYSENLINFVTRRKICATNLYGNLLGFSLTSDFIDCSFFPCSNLTMKSLLGLSCDEKQFPLLLLYSQSSSTSSRDYKFSSSFFIFFHIFFPANADRKSVV